VTSHLRIDYRRTCEDMLSSRPYEHINDARVLAQTEDLRTK